MARYHDLDALRTFAMLLGIALHACVFLLPVDFWPVQDEWAQSVDITKNPYAYLLSFIHGFRMPVFFLLSGFFTAMLWQSRGVFGLVQHRLKRIGLPLLAGALTVVPATEWLFAGEEDFGLLAWSLAWLGGFYHLWFLWYLLLLLVLFILLAQLLSVQFRSPWWWLVLPLVFVPQYLMVEPQFGADNPAASVFPTPRLLVYYALFFFFGVFFSRRQIAVRAWWTAALAMALMPVFPAALLSLYPEQFLGETPPWSRVTASALQAAYAWLMCFGCMGLFCWVASANRAWIRYLSDASYWLYITHLPLVVLLQKLAVNWPIGVHAKYLSICAAVVAVLLVCYHFCVRYTAVGTLLNGPRTRPAAARAG